MVDDNLIGDEAETQLVSTPEPLDVVTPESLMADRDSLPDQSQQTDDDVPVYLPQRKAYGDSDDRDSKRMWIVAAAVACGLLAVLIGGIASRLRKAEAPQKAQEEIEIPKTMAVARGDVHTEVDSTGTVETDGIFGVRSEVGGTVVDVQVYEGQQVWEGTVLLTLTNGELSQAAQDAQTKVERAEQDVEAAEKTFDEAKSDWEDARKLYDTEYLAYTDAVKVYQEAVKAAANAQAPVAPAPIEIETATDEEKAAYKEAYEYYETQKAAYDAIIDNLAESASPVPPVIDEDDLLERVETAERDVRDAKTALEEAKTELEKATKDDEKRVIKAPVSGRVVSVAEVGTVVRDPTIENADQQEKDEPLVKISDLKTITVDVTVPEESIDSIKLGQQARLSFVDIPDFTCLAKVEEIIPQSVTAEQDNNQPVRHVRLVVPDADERLLPGMAANVTIITADEQQALVVPLTVVSDSGGMKTVKVLLSEETGKVETRTVRLGASDGTNVVILDGLSEGELVVLPNQ